MSFGPNQDHPYGFPQKKIYDQQPQRNGHCRLVYGLDQSLDLVLITKFKKNE